MAKAATPCFSPRIPSASLSTRSDCTHRDSWSAADLDTIMHGVAEAGSVRASQWLRREHAAKYSHPLDGPGCLVESKHQEMHSKRLFLARQGGQSAWALGFIRSEYDEARNRIHARNGKSKGAPASVGLRKQLS